MHLNISSLSYHYREFIIKIFNLIIKPNIIEISETRLENEKEPITYIFVPSYVYEHTSTESGKGKTFVYTNK